MRNHTIHTVILLLIGLMIHSHLHAQKEGAIWYFGQYAGLDFNQYYPKPLTEGRVNTREGVASISDSEGRLLFYTDGDTIYNREHQPMMNGFGLFGNSSSTQSSIIIPDPGSSSEYYVFTVDKPYVDGSRGHGINYSKVNMNAAGGLGAVRENKKNIPILNNVEFTEKITAVKHKNGRDYWIITHGWKTWAFQVFLVNPLGIIFHDEFLAGSVHQNGEDDRDQNFGATGYMKSSPRGDLLVCAIQGLGFFELFRFNNETGEIKFIVKLPADDWQHSGQEIYGAYGVEFSPLSNYLYGSTRKGGLIYQWDLGVLSEEENNDTIIRSRILSSRQILWHKKEIPCGAMQLGINGKIYISFSGQQYLGVINAPTQEDCKFVPRGASLIDNEAQNYDSKGYFGLPTFLPDFFREAKFYYENTCQNDTTLFYLSTTFGVDPGVFWEIYKENDPKPIDTVYADDEFLGYHVFEEAGKYNVLLKNLVQFGTSIETEPKELIIHAAPETALRDTSYMCGNHPVKLDAGYGAFYIWGDSTNSQIRTRFVSKEGTYTVKVIHYNGCYARDTTKVIKTNPPTIDSLDITAASCGADNGSIEIFIDRPNNEISVNWVEFPDSINQFMLSNLSAGPYSVLLTDLTTLCTSTHLLTVGEEDAPPVKINASITDTICTGTEVILTASGAQRYEWIGLGILDKQITVKPIHDTVFTVRGSNTNQNQQECSEFASISIHVFPYIKPNLGEDRSICSGTPYTLFGGNDYLEWNWSTGDTTQNIIIDSTYQNLWLEVVDSNMCQLRDTVNIDIKPLPNVDLGEDRAICLDHEIVLSVEESDSVIWNTGARTNKIFITHSDIYEVTAYKDGCKNQASVRIQVNHPDSLRIDSVSYLDISCPGKTDGEIRIFTEGQGTFYSYSINYGETFEQNHGLFENLEAGSYQLVVWEDSACSLNYPTEVVIKEAEPILIDYRQTSPSCDLCDDGEILLDVEGGNPPYDILWTNLETGMRRTNLSLGDYPVWVTDSHGCREYAVLTLEMGHFSQSIPNAFTPNGDGVNETWEIPTIEGFPQSLVQVFDRFGRMVFESERGYNRAWDGRGPDGDIVPIGSYYYIIYLNDVNPAVTGTVTIIR